MATVSFECDNEIRNIIDTVCKHRGESVSTFMRRATLKELAELGYLDADRMKALGIQEE